MKIYYGVFCICEICIFAVFLYYPIVGLPLWLSNKASTFAGDAGDVGSILVWEDPLEEDMATHSSIPAWRIPRKEKPRGLHSIALQRVGRD